VFSDALDVAQFDPLLRSRYRLDPPEFFTMLGGTTDGLHWGYYGDNPTAGEWVVASYFHSNAYRFSIDGQTLLEAIRFHLERVAASLQEYLVHDAKHAEHYAGQLHVLDRIRTLLQTFETGDRAAQGQNYVDQYAASRTVTAPNSAGIGLVVDGATYCETPEIAALLAQAGWTEAEKVRLLALGHASIDNGFAGTALRIGQELWADASNHFQAVSELLDRTYLALGRAELRKALQAAVKFRAASGGIL
ncbi:MAG TPA: ADP-ribosylation family protein, partial [Bacteroidia bacterium]|nr:ADP-ribosylation family protein [Bacteroidia bacterium]